MPAAERVIDLDAELVGLLDRAPVFGHEVVVHVAERARHEPRPVRQQHRSGQRDVLLRHGAEPLHRNPVVGERVADESGAIGVGACRRRVVNRDSPSLAVDPVRKISVPHFRRRHAAEGGVAALLVVEALVRHEEKRAVPPVVHSRDPDRTTERSPDVPLFVDALRLLEESLLVQRVVTEEAIRRSLQDVGPGLRRERDAATAGLPELRLESVGLDREFGNRLERRREKRRFGDVGLPVGVDGHAIQGCPECPALSAPERDRRVPDTASGLRLGHGGDEIERAAHRAADDERKLVDQSVRHRGRNLRVLGLQRGVLGDDVHQLGHRAEVERHVDTGRQSGGEDDSLRRSTSGTLAAWLRCDTCPVAGLPR